jgi:D-inositol-3-phosphate glycosyltransferase
VIHIPAGPEHPYDKHLVQDHLPQFVDGVLRQAEVDEVRYDVIHSHYWLSGVAALMLREEWNAPTIHMFHTLGKLKNIVARTPSEIETDRRIEAETRITREVDAIVAATLSEEGQLSRLYCADPSRIHTVSPGVDVERFRPIPMQHAKEQIGLCQERRVILFVGRIEPLKGIDHLLRAIAEVVKKQPGLREGLCVPIIGGNTNPVEADDEMIRLQALHSDLGIEDIVTFLGAQDQDALHYYYSAAEMVVMPSDYESFGMVALEAMACGTPVVASDVGGLSYLVREGRTGFRVPARNAQALSDRILRLLQDEGLRRRIGQRASCWAQSHSWQNVSDRIEALYSTVLAVSK